MGLSKDQFGRFHFVNSVEYLDVPLYLRVSEYLVARGCRLLESQNKSELDKHSDWIRRLFYEGIAISKIAVIMGCGESALYHWKKRNQLYRHGGYK